MHDPFIERIVTTERFGTPFSTNVANARRYLRLMQKDISTRLGVCPASVVNWESGHATPNLQKFVQLCVELKTTPNKLLGFES